MDYGTGSGVLAVAALLMGAASAVRGIGYRSSQVHGVKPSAPDQP